MKRSIFFLFLTGLFLTLQSKAQTQEVKMDSFSYSLGVLMAQNLKKQGLSELDATNLARGVEDVLKGNPLKVEVAQANQIVQDQMQAIMAKQYEKIIQEGKQFLETNAKRPEVVSLPSGLQYEVLRAGEGAVPTAEDKVVVHYQGTLIDGTIFDSSIERGQPATFGVTQVIQGWVEALQLMKVGSKWRLFIPYQLAYGERGAGQKIGPYSTLIFDVELLEIKE